MVPQRERGFLEEKTKGVHDMKVRLGMKPRIRQEVGSRLSDKYYKLSLHPARRPGPRAQFLLDPPRRRKTVTKIVPRGRRSNGSGSRSPSTGRLRSLVKELVEVSEQTCQAKLDGFPGPDGSKKRAPKDASARNPESENVVVPSIL